MAPTNGKLPSDLLVTIQGIPMARDTAFAFGRANLASGNVLKLAKPAGGYRDLDVQADMIENPARYNLDPASKVKLGRPGYSSHGWGDRLDLAVGAGRTWMLSNAGRFGFVREFGSADPGHYKYLHETWPTAPISTPLTPSVQPSTIPEVARDKAAIKRVAAMLNARVLGIDSNAVHDGVPGYAFWLEVQRAGRQDGLYPPPYRIDGIPGPKTYQVLAHYAARVR